MGTQETIVELRKRLHKLPELAGNEYQTAHEIIDFLKDMKPDSLQSNIAGTGIIAVFDTKKTGPHIIFRAELDGLPITEENPVKYTSKHKGCSHSCGHDGHLAMLLGLAQYFSQHKELFCGKIILLFQPAEETAQGARDIIQTQILETFTPTCIFGCHNLPGYPIGQIIIKKGRFTSASQGLILHIYGKTSHAGHPDQGRNPMHATIEILHSLENISQIYNKKEKDTFLTIIHVKLGERAFGTSPGHAIVMATYRSTHPKLLEKMTKESFEHITRITKKHNLTWTHEWVELFPEIRNNPAYVDIIESAAKKLHLSIHHINKPFTWSEDFSYYLASYPGAFFGIGAGIEQQPLHSPLYDFPDTLLPIGISLYIQLIHETIQSYAEALK
jgi:amidohydrolase